MAHFDKKRERMVHRDIEGRGVADQGVLNRMRLVPRHEFVDPDVAEHAYEDRPLPIGHEQTISQPYIVAVMIETAQVQPTDRVLEIGTGSGYSAAVISTMCSEVYTVETVEPLAADSAARLERLGYRNVHVKHGDGTLGWREHAPYDVIIVTAGAPHVPESLKAQLAEGGRLVAPVASGRYGEVLTLLTKLPGGGFEEQRGEGVAFVPLLGEEGYSQQQAAENKRHDGFVFLLG